MIHRRLTFSVLFVLLTLGPEGLAHARLCASLMNDRWRLESATPESPSDSNAAPIGQTCRRQPLCHISRHPLDGGPPELKLCPLVVASR
jgi:hypothetical protein